MEYNFNTINGRIYTHSDIMEHYSNIVPFLGIALGEMHEVALLDCRTKHLIAIANGHISGRNVGDPMTNLACDIVEKGDWRHSDFIANYSGVSSEGKLLRSSSYFIKHNDELLGMLCINVDTSVCSQISELALKIGGMVPSCGKAAENASEVFVDSISSNINQVLTELYGNSIPSHFSMDERMSVLKMLNDRKVFLIKGAVPRVAKLLGCSEPTIYRGLKTLESAV